jgi:hypothetical protein
VTRCVECGFDFAEPDVTVIIRAMRRAATDIDTACAPGAVTVERARRRPEPNTWCALEYLGHTVLALDWYRARIVRVLQEDVPQLTGYDFDAAARRANDGARDLAELLTEFDDATARFVATIEPLDGGAMARCGTGSEGQPRSVLRLTASAAHEAAHHALDIRRCLSLQDGRG